LTSLNLANNNLSRGVRGKAKYLNSDPNKDDHWEWACEMSGVIAIANAIKDMLTSLILKDNRLLTVQAGNILSGMVAANTVLTELDVSSNRWRQNEYYPWEGDGPGFAQEFAIGLGDNGALTSLNLASNSLCGVNEYGGTFDASGNACFHCNS
jgi:hypothetical protein